MNNAQLEAWVLDVVDRVARHLLVEDSRVELKSEWPTDLQRAARQIAALSNAARGEQALWIVGVDEKSGRISDLPAIEISDWYNQIRSRFDGPAPEIETHLVVPVGTRNVSALLFRTDRPPYVVKTASGGNVDREVPWRSANSTGSATREQLIRMLAPAASLPNASFLTSEVYLWLGSPNKLNWTIGSNIFIAPGITPAVFPFHRCWASIQSSERREITRMGIEFRAPQRPEADLVTTRTEATFRGPAVVLVHGGREVVASERPERLRVVLTLRPVGTDQSVVIEAEHPLVGEQSDGERLIWRYVAPDPWDV